MSILDEILANKRGEIERAIEKLPRDEMRACALARGDVPRGFRDALRKRDGVRVIAEVKRRSPSKGEIRPDADPARIAIAYQTAGAAAISVLTDAKFFGGSLDDLRAVRRASRLPVLRKEFVVDAYQIDEAAAAGADAILLIVSALPQEDLAAFHAHAQELGLDVLVEVHDEGELARAIEIDARVIGVNNRNLATFVTDLAVTESLAPGVPKGAVLVAESGILQHSDIVRLQACGAAAFLVGESLMRESDVGHALRRLRGEP